MERLTRRKYLCKQHPGGKKKFIDMEEVYREIDNGMTLEEVARKHEVSVMTLRRRHRDYQKMVEILLEKEAADSEYDLPPLPEKF